MKAPNDVCVCGHVRNQHNRYGDGRCLAVGCRACPGHLVNAAVRPIRGGR